MVNTLVLVEPAQEQDSQHCPPDLPGLEWRVDLLLVGRLRDTVLMGEQV